MERVNKILINNNYIENLQKIKRLERGRAYCKHNIRHLLDVGRIAYILNLENGLGYEKELIYAAALLHDIGKHEQYTRGIPHEKAGARIAPTIMMDSGFEMEEIRTVVEAILSHRTNNNQENTLKQVLYKADKLSRNCFSCKASKSCKWNENKRNKGIYC